MLTSHRQTLSIIGKREDALAMALNHATSQLVQAHGYVTARADSPEGFGGRVVELSCGQSWRIEVTGVSLCVDRPAWDVVVESVELPPWMRKP